MNNEMRSIIKNLVIVESPNKCNTIQKYLGDEFKVISCVGHFRDLSKGRSSVKDATKRYGFNPETLEIKWEIKKDPKIMKELKDSIAKAKHVYIATDPDREGEAIGWHLKDHFGIEEDKYNRIVFNAVRKETVEAALKNPTKIDIGLYNAYLVRRLLDRVIGWDLSEFIQKKLNLKKYVDTAGRVQSVALWFVAHREQEIQSFVPKEFYTIEGEIEVGDQLVKIKYPQNKPEELEIKKEVAADFVKIMPKEITITDLETKMTQSKPLTAFNTASLFRAAYNSLGMTPKRVMSNAQELFEKGYISYHRTDSIRIEKPLQETIKKFIDSTIGKDYIGEYVARGKSSAQDAHEAITALNFEMTPEEFNKKEPKSSAAKVYELIYNRTISCFMMPPKYEKTIITLEAATLKFNVIGSRILFDGYTKLTGKSTEDLILPKLEIGQKLPIKIIEAIQNHTKPLPRYNAASLIKKLESEEVGRPSTYSSMVEAVITDKKGYAELDGKQIKATKKGIEVSKILEENFSNVISPSYTKNLELDLDSIANAKIDHSKWFKDFKKMFDNVTKEAYIRAKQKEYEKSGENCPECKEPLIIKPSKKSDKYLTCSSDTCEYYKVEWKEHDTKCPNCEIPFLVKKNNSGIEFLACSNYPECKNTARIDGFVSTKTGEVCAEEDCAGNIMQQKNKKTGELFGSCEFWLKHRKPSKWKKGKKTAYKAKK